MDAVISSPGLDSSSAATNDILCEGPGSRIGPYKLLQLLGEGGFGAVFMAEQEQPIRRTVALKIIKLGMDTRQVVARFEQERQALALMDHPNIAHVLDAGATETGRPYFVMELVRGTPIVEYCDKNNLTIPERLELFVQVCTALQHAHSKGLIHRDLKPSNVLVGTHEGKAQAKVIDFGIAKATSSKLTDKTLFTEHLQVIGTLQYMSPEQAQGSIDIDTRSDVYSLGVLLYELLAGSSPFDPKALGGAMYGEVQRMIVDVEPPKPSTRLRESQATLLRVAAHRRLEPKQLGQVLKGELDWMVMKAMEKDRVRRYETAAGFAADVRRFLTSEPVLAAPPSRTYRLRKFARRNRAGFIAGLVVALALVLGIAGTTLQWRRAVAEMQRAEAAEHEASAARDAADEQRQVAQDRLYEALLREARTLRARRQLGYRRDVFERVRQAAAIPSRARNTEVLRAEASQCLGDPIGLDPVVLQGFYSNNIPPGEAGALTQEIHPSGTVIAATTPAGALLLLDAETGEVASEFTDPGNICQLAFAHSAFRLFGLIMAGDPAAGTAEYTLAEWRRAGVGAWSLHDKHRLEGPASLLSTPTCALLAQARANGKGFGLTNLESGASCGSVPTLPLAVAPERQLAALAGEADDVLVLWDVREDREIARIATEMSSIGIAEFNEDGGLLACKCATGILVWDTARTNDVTRYRGYFHETTFVDRTTLALPLPQENIVRFINISTNAETARLGMGAWMFRVAREARVALAIGRKAQVVRLDNTQDRRRLLGHSGGVPQVEFSRDGTRLVSVGKDRTVRIWNAETGAEERSWMINSPGQTACFSPDGSHVLTGEWSSKRVQLWSVEDARIDLTLEMTSGDSQAEVESAVFSASMSHDGRLVAATGSDGLWVWELQPPGSAETAWHARLVRHVGGQVWAHQFDRKAEQIAYFDAHSDLESLFRIRLGDATAEPERLMQHGGGIQWLGRSGVSDLLFTRNMKREVEILDPETRQLLRTIDLQLPGEDLSAVVGNVSVSPDETRLAIPAATGRSVCVVDVASGKRLFTLPDEPGSVWWLSWSPDSKRLCVARSEGDISIWDLTKAEGVLVDAKLWDFDAPDLEPK